MITQKVSINGKVKMGLLSLLLCVVLVHEGMAQRILWIDRGWKAPAEAGDTVTFERLQAGWFPVYSEDLNATITALEGLLRGVERAEGPLPAGARSLGHSQLYIAPPQKTGGSSAVYLRTFSGNYSTELLLLARQSAPAPGARRLYQALDYFRNGRAVLGADAVAQLRRQ